MMLSRYSEQIAAMHNLLGGEMNLRELTQKNVDMLEKDLRKIILSLRKSSEIKILIPSPEALEESIWNAIYNLYLASDILDKVRHTHKDRELLYQKFRECAKHLSEALECLQQRL